MPQILNNTGVKLWSKDDYSELWLSVFEELTGTGGKSNIRLIDEAIGNINTSLDGYYFLHENNRLYICKDSETNITKIPVSLVNSDGKIASSVDGTTITIDENGVIHGTTIDDAFSNTSTNPVQNKVVKEKFDDIETKVNQHEQNISTNTSDINTIKQDIATNTAGIASNLAKITENETAISSNTSAIATLNGEGEGSVKKIAEDAATIEVAKIVADAPEDFDTLKEMSDWISNHENDASAMNSAIQQNTTNIATHTGDTTVHITDEERTLWNTVNNKVDKIEGKGLSTEDYTTVEKTKLGNIDSELLGKLGESIDGTLTFNGSEIKTNTDYIADTKEDAQAAIDAGLVENGASVYVKNDADSFAVMTGATSTKNGSVGFVPAPLAGQENLVLHGDGTWRDEGNIDNSVNVVDSLTSTSTTDALSANQGKVLKGITDDLNSTTIGLRATVNNLSNSISGKVNSSNPVFTGSFECGEDVNATGNNSIAFGNLSQAQGQNSFAGGYQSFANGARSFAYGYHCVANSTGSVAFGSTTTAYGECGSAFGFHTSADNFASFACGQYNRSLNTGGTSGYPNGDMFAIGNGYGSDMSQTLSNAMRVTWDGIVYGKKEYVSSGADYAEFIKPWLDGNADGEDRVGYFVTIKNGLLEKANDGDYIVGITSGNPSVVGNGDEEYYWRYERDEFNRIIMEDVPELQQKVDDEGNPAFDKETGYPVMEETGKIIKNARMKISDDYDDSLQDSYIERRYRKEWDYVGMVGVLPTRDDGTCIPDKFCKCKDGGIATLAEERGFDTYLVIERISDNVVSVLLK